MINTHGKQSITGSYTSDTPEKSKSVAVTSQNWLERNALVGGSGGAVDGVGLKTVQESMEEIEKPLIISPDLRSKRQSIDDYASGGDMTNLNSATRSKHANADIENSLKAQVFDD